MITGISGLGYQLKPRISEEIISKEIISEEIINMTNPFWSNIFRKQDDSASKITDLFLQTPLFKNIPASICRQIVEQMHVRYYAKNEIVFKQGELGAGAVLITSGEVLISSAKKPLAKLTEGDFFGEIALVLDEPRTADATACTECELVFLLKQDIDEWINRSPRYGAVFMKNVAYLIANRLKQANQVLSNNDS